MTQKIPIITFEHILCLILPLIYPGVYLLKKDLGELVAPELCQNCDIFPEKMMEGIFVYVLKYMLTIVSLDKMQIIVPLMRKSSKSEGKAF